MSNLIIAIQVMIPICIPMLLGFAARKVNWVSESLIYPVNSLIVRIFLPIMLFCNIYSGSPELSIPLRLLIYLPVCVTALFLFLSVLIPRLVKEPSRRGTLIQGILRSNTAIYGLPVGMSLLGAEYLPIFSIIISVVVIPYSMLSIITLEINRAEKVSIPHIIKQVFTSPILISILLALLLNALKITLPEILLTSLKSMGNIITPLAFFILGAGFSFSAIAKNKTAIFCATIARLVIVPLVFIGIAIALGFRGVDLICVFLVFAPPTAISSYPLACAMGGDAELASELVVFTSAFSVITIFLWIYVFYAFALI